MLEPATFGHTPGGVSYMTGAFPTTCNAMFTKPTLLLLAHANGFCKEIWKPLLDDLCSLVSVEPKGSSETEKQLTSESTERYMSKQKEAECPRLRYVAIDFLGHGQSAPLLTNVDTVSRIPLWRESLVPVLREVLDHNVHITKDDDFTNSQWDIVGIGHSLGATGLIMYELKYPGHLNNMVLFEPVLLPPTNVSMSNDDIYFPDLISHRNPLIRRALKRKKSWKSNQEAFNFFKLRFSSFDDRVLTSYVNDGLHRPFLKESCSGNMDRSAGNNVDQSFLRCQPTTEAAYYAAVGRSLFARLKEIKSPATFVAGGHSDHFDGPWGDTVSHFKKVAQHLPGKSFVAVISEGSHFCVMEYPKEGASIVLNAINKAKHCLL